jgi:hypothetical protein
MDVAKQDALADLSTQTPGAPNVLSCVVVLLRMQEPFLVVARFEEEEEEKDLSMVKSSSDFAYFED